MKKLLLTLLLVSTSAYAFNGVLVKQYREGSDRICVYRDGSQTRTLVVHASNPCPVNYSDER